MTYRYTKRQTAVAMLAALNSSWNQNNSLILMSEAARDASEQFRTPVRSTPFDAMVFNYLNTYEQTFNLHNIGIINERDYQIHMFNAVNTFSKVSDVELNQFLNRGYSESFKEALFYFSKRQIR